MNQIRVRKTKPVEDAERPGRWFGRLATAQFMGWL